jgi:hypothetical protein
MNAFWASENCEAVIVLRSSQPGIGAEDSNQKRSSFVVSEQMVRWTGALSSKNYFEH